MITVAEAKEKIMDNTALNKLVERSVLQALNYYLAETIFSPVAIPMFNQSAMDGYAFKFEDVNELLTVVDEIPAGDTREISIKKGEAVRIFTGSKVPDSCDTVVMQELVELNENQLKIKDEGLMLGGNVRLQGNQIEVGAIALKKGDLINAGAIGFLSAMGITHVKVYAKPTVTVIATGSELVKPGGKLMKGQIYESNTFMLEAALFQQGIEPKVYVVEDDRQLTQEIITTALKESDVLLLSGGISVGDYDFVKEALEKNDVKEVFYKVKQKPGKPLYFGKTPNTLIFALPGNPAAALSCFYEYVTLSINLMMGNQQPQLPVLSLPINKSYTKKAGRANFLKGYTNFKTVTPLDGQSSDALQAFAMANCLIFIDEEISLIKEGEHVEVHLLPV